MEHYRIVETVEGFKVQQRFLWFFWLTCAEPTLHCDSSYDWYIGDSIYYYYETFNEAKEAVERMKNMIITYKGHEIMYGFYGNEIYWIDLNSKFHKSEHSYYSRCSKYLNDIKRDIDKLIEEKEYNKEQKKVKNIYYL